MCTFLCTVEKIVPKQRIYLHFVQKRCIIHLLNEKICVFDKDCEVRTWKKTRKKLRLIRETKPARV